MFIHTYIYIYFSYFYNYSGSSWFELCKIAPNIILPSLNKLHDIANKIFSK